MDDCWNFWNESYDTFSLQEPASNLHFEITIKVFAQTSFEVLFCSDRSKSCWYTRPKPLFTSGSSVQACAHLNACPGQAKCGETKAEAECCASSLQQLFFLISCICFRAIESTYRKACCISSYRGSWTSSMLGTQATHTHFQGQRPVFKDDPEKK